VDVALEPAGFGSRFAAALLDGAIQFVVVMLLVMISIPTVMILSTPGGDINWGGLSGVFLAILLLAFGFLFFFYKLLFEAFWNGQTIGKRVLGIRVVQLSGLPAGFLQVVVRNLMRVVDYLPANYLVGAVVVLASRHHQRLGDMVAGTVVVRERRAPAPQLPPAISVAPEYDVTRLQEHVLRLTEPDLAAARSFWQRRSQLEPKSRSRVATAVAEGLARRMGWMEPITPTAEHFIEAVLFVRARPV
jgi:uncharacterized RDD family membrane protein YckC